MSGMRRLLAASLAVALAGVMAACAGGGGSSLPSNSPAPSTGPRAQDTNGSAGATIRIPLSGAAPDAIAIDGTTAWVLAGEGGTLMEVDLGASRQVRSIDVGFGATHLALPLPGVAAVARFDSSGSGSYLPVVELETGVLNGVSTGALGGLSDGADGVIWALEKAGRLLQVDVARRAIVGDAAVHIGRDVHTEVQWGAGAAWVGSDGTPVLRIGADMHTDATIEVETGLPFVVHGGLVWGAGPAQLWAIDPDSNEIARRIALEQVFEVLALDIDGNDAWLAIRHPGPVGAVLRLDLASGNVVQEFPVSLPAAVRIAPDRAWVASYLTNELIGFAR